MGQGVRRVMFSLDRIIRDKFTLNGLLPCSVSIPHMKGSLANGAVRLPLFDGATQQDEATAIVSMLAVLAQGGGVRVAILVRKCGALANLITDELAKEDISYFNGLFSDTGSEFTEFNAFALSEITDAASGEKGISRSSAEKSTPFLINC